MIIVKRMTARVPGSWEAEARGALAPSWGIVEELAPGTPDGEDVAFTRQSYEFLEGSVWRGEGRSRKPSP